MLLALIIAGSPQVEVTLFPFTAQMNGINTQEYGHAADGWLSLRVELRDLALSSVAF